MVLEFNFIILMCRCVCVYVHMVQVCVCVCTHGCRCVCVYAHMGAGVYVWMYTRVQVPSEARALNPLEMKL